MLQDTNYITCEIKMALLLLLYRILEKNLSLGKYFTGCLFACLFGLISF